MRKTLVLTVGILMVLVAVPSLLADGPAVFKAKCAACHGADGTGQTAVGKTMKIRDFHSADVQKQSDADLTKIIEGGKNKMPAFKGKLTADEIASVVKVIRSLK
jgi:cytochrome c6